MVEIEANARYDLAEVVARFAPGAPLRTRARDTKEFCDALETLAFSALLARADLRRYAVHLVQAADNWRALLTSARGDPARVPASWNGPLLGALCCGPEELGSAIARLSAREIVPPEYDDEFLAALFIQDATLRAAGAPVDAAALERICDDIDGYLEEETPRSQALRALARGDRARFEPAFRAWSRSEAEARQERAEAPVPTDRAIVGRHLWLEGLGVLELARRAGMEADVTGCEMTPPLARRAPRVSPSEAPFLLGRVAPDQEP